MKKLVLLVMLLAPLTAEAKGLMLLTHGDTVKDRGELTPTLKEEIEESTVEGARMGYCYSYFGLFWIDFWTWDGAPCIFKDKTVWKLSEENLASYAALAPEQVSKPFFYRVPEGLLILLPIALLIAWGVIIGARDKKRMTAMLASDPRYKHALELLEKDKTGATARAYLTENGIEADTAEKDVSALKDAFVKADEA